MTDAKTDEGNVDPSNPAVEPAVTTEPMPGDPEPSGDHQGGDLRVALREARDKQQSLKAELEIMRQIAGDQVLFDANGRPVPKPQPQQIHQQQQPSNNQVSAEMEKLWEDNPRKAVQMEIMSAMSWRDNMDSQVDRQEAEVTQKYADYGKYRDTVRQYVRALPLDQRSKPGVIDLAYYVVKGQASGNIYEQAQAEIIRKIQAGEQVQGLSSGTASAPAPVKGMRVTPEQAAAAEMMGMTPEEYASHVVVKAGTK